MLTFRIKCVKCKLYWKVFGPNLAVLGQPCMVCGEFNHFAEAIKRVYGEVVGATAKLIFSAIEKSGSKKNSDVNDSIALAERKLQMAIELYGGQNDK